MDLTEREAARFWAKVDKTETCWNWTGTKTPPGYGKLSLRMREWYAHRLSYTLARGPIPAGRQIDHRCDNKSCVRPDHLAAVTPRENLLRSDGMAARNAAKSHCPAGHPYSGQHLSLRPNGDRYCRTCQRERDALRYRLKRLAANN